MNRRSWTRRLVIADVLVSGFAGALADRALVASPAWRATGAKAWADYSKHANLGPGRLLYPAYGVGLLAATLATAASYRADRRAPSPPGPPIYLAAVFAAAVIATTAKAAPTMLSTPNLHSEAATQLAFHKFTLWGVYIRGVFSVLAFRASDANTSPTNPSSSARTRSISPACTPRD